MSRSLPSKCLGCLLFSLLAVAVVAAEPEANQGVVGHNVAETLQRGGAVMYVILAASVLGVALILELLFRTRRSRILPLESVKALESVDPADATAVQRFLDGDQAICINRIVQIGHQWRHGSAAQCQAAIEETVADLVWQLKRSARPIGIIANTTPLLGLLGTVIGIIQAFDVVAREGALGDPGALAGGISKALLTTCFGLIVAIPMLLAYHLLVGRIESLLHRAEALVKAIFVQPPGSDEPEPVTATAAKTSEESAPE